MDYGHIKELAKVEKKNIEVYKKKIIEIKNKMLQVTDKNKQESYLNSIDFLNHVISEKEKLVNDIETGNIFKIEN